MPKNISLLLIILAALHTASNGEDPAVFADRMEDEPGTRWTANSCLLVREMGRVCEGEGSLRLVDRGGNAQAYVLLSAEPGCEYVVTGRAFRLPANRGTWLGKIAVSRAGGRVSSGNYLASSDFIEKPGTWETLEFTFTSPGDRIYLILIGQNGTGDVTVFDDVQICARGKRMQRLDETFVTSRKPLDTVQLAGRPEEIGAIWGRINRDAIRNDMEEHYLVPARKANISPTTLILRAGRFVELANQFAPHWLAEARALARAAEVDGDLYLSFIANVYRGLYAQDECTSYAVSPECTESNRIFFHKNRDNAPKKQCAFILSNATPGVNKFISTSDACVIACMMLVNEKGLAGSADTGGLKVGRPKYRGWMNTFLLRHIAERASTCEEALSIVEDFVANGNYAGGARTGTHWLFVDAAGKVLEISNNSDRVEHKYHTKKVYFSARHNTNAPRILEHAKSPIDFATFHNVSRDPSMCFKTSVSGMSVEISRQHPSVLTCAWVSLPAKALSFPLSMAGTETPLALLNGDAFSLAQAIDVDREIWERIEAGASLSQRLVEEKATTLLDAGKGGQAAQALSDWALACADSHLAILRK